MWQVAQLRQQLAASRADAAALRYTLKQLQGGGGVAAEGVSAADAGTRAAFEELQAKVALLEVVNARLQREFVSLNHIRSFTLRSFGSILY